MFNMNYQESEHMKEVRENYLEKIKEEPKESLEQISESLDKVDYYREELQDSEKAYMDGYLQGQTDTMILTGIGLAVGCVIGAVMNCLRK